MVNRSFLPDVYLHVMPHPFYEGDTSYKFTLLIEKDFEKVEEDLPVLDCVIDCETYQDVKKAAEGLARKLNVPYVLKLSSGL